jgi:hypothetical protein
MQKRLDISINGDTAQEMREEAVRRYKNNRSLSRMIEELWEDRREPPVIEMIKASRKEYEKWYHKNEKKYDVLRRELALKCNTCEAYFMTSPTDAEYCPSCGSPDLTIDDDEAHEEQKSWYTPKYVEIDRISRPRKKRWETDRCGGKGTQNERKTATPDPAGSWH